MTVDLAILGDLLPDIIVPIERFPIEAGKHGWAEGLFIEPGGAGNVLVAARRVNLNCASLAHLGTDYYAATMLQMLADEGVNIDNVIVSEDYKTIICLVLSDQSAQHVYFGIRHENQQWTVAPDWHEVIASAKAMYTDGYTLHDLIAAEDMFEACDVARRAGVPVFFDPSHVVSQIVRANLIKMISLIDVLLLNEDEAAAIVGEAAIDTTLEKLLALGPRVVVLKLGPKGCVVATSSSSVEVPGFEVEVVDTVGAGDSFAAAFVAGWIRGGSLEHCARLANAMGAMTSTQRAAGTRIPSRERLLELLDAYPEARKLA